MALSGATYYYLETEPFYTPKGFEAIHEVNDLPQIVAHKSYIKSYPGNTLEAMKEVINSHIKGIELDVQLTADKVAIVFHDDNLEDLTTGHGPVSEKSLQEIKSVRYRQKGEGIESRIPTLEEVFQEVGGKLFIFIEAKEYSVFDDQLVKKIAFGFKNG